MKLKIAELYDQLQLEFPANGEFFKTCLENFYPKQMFFKQENKIVEIIQYDVDKLTIDSSITADEIKYAFDNYRVIPLRKINPLLNTLIIGCGNNPISDSGGNPLNLKNFEHAEYRSEHYHSSAITIDPCMSKNPTIVGMFGWQPIAGLFGGKQFKKIVLEGVNLFDDPNLAHILADLAALLLPNGLIIMTHLARVSLCYTFETFKAAYYCNDPKERFALAEIVDEHFEYVDTNEVHAAFLENIPRL